MITEAVTTARAVRVHRHAGGADGLGVLRRRGRRRPPARPERISPSPCAQTPRSAPRSPPSAMTPGRRSAIPAPSGMTSCGRWVSDAEVAEVEYTAFASRRAGHHRPADRPPRPRPQHARRLPGQGELFTAWRYHAVFTDSPFVMLQAEEHHRGHAQAEQVFADWTDGPLAHLPSGSFPANAAWLALAAISCNLLRAAGALASLAYAKARGATIRRDLVNVAARTARHGRGHLTLHLPESWHRDQEWLNLYESDSRPTYPSRSDQPRSGHRTPAPRLTRQTATAAHPANTSPGQTAKPGSGSKCTPPRNDKSAPPAPGTPGKTIARIHAVDPGLGLSLLANVHRLSDTPASLLQPRATMHKQDNRVEEDGHAPHSPRSALRVPL